MATGNGQHHHDHNDGDGSYADLHCNDHCYHNAHDIDDDDEGGICDYVAGLTVSD